MAIIPSNFATFVTNASTMVRQAYSSAPISYPEYVTTIPTSTEVYLDGWIGRMPKGREWIGPRVSNEPAPQTYQTTVLPFELTYTFDRFFADDDQYGVYYPMLQDLALQAKMLPEYQLRDFIEASGAYAGATSQQGLDGVSFFNTAHPVDFYNAGAGTYVNDFTGGGVSVGGVTVGGALSAAAFGSVAEYMMTLKAEDGERLGITPDLLIIPPTLMGAAEYILKNAFSAPQTWDTFGALGTQVGAADNIYRRFGVRYLINKHLASNTKWYIGDTTKAIKPLRWIQHTAPVFVQRVNENDPVVFDNHAFIWGWWARGVPAWSYPWLMARSGP